MAVTLCVLLPGPARRLASAESDQDLASILLAYCSTLNVLCTRSVVTSLHPSDWTIVFWGCHFQTHGQHAHQSVSSQAVVKSTFTTHSLTLFEKRWSRGGSKLARYVVLTLEFPGSLYPGYPIITFYSDLKWDNGAWHQPWLFLTTTAPGIARSHGWPLKWTSASGNNWQITTDLCFFLPNIHGAKMTFHNPYPYVDKSIFHCRSS